MSLFYKTLRAIVYPIGHLIFRIKKVGKENIPKDTGIILCCNHTSIMDIVFLILSCNRQIFFMAKKELFKNKLVAWLFLKMGAFPVERGAAARESLDYATKLVKDGKIMGIFPEGTRYKEGRPQRAKSGVAIVAMNTSASVLPVSLYKKGKHRLFSKVTVRFGEIIPSENLKMFENSKNELKRVSTLIMDKIVEQWELGF